MFERSVEALKEVIEANNSTYEWDDDYSWEWDEETEEERLQAKIEEKEGFYDKLADLLTKRGGDWNIGDSTE